MAMELKSGSRWRSAVSDVEVIVVRAPSGPWTWECGGQPMVPHGADKPAGLTIDPMHAEATAVGKRFADEESGVEVLCTKAGEGSLSIDGVALPMKGAKPLPSSD
jgi:hypothetical protein